MVRFIQNFGNFESIDYEKNIPAMQWGLFVAVISIHLKNIKPVLFPLKVHLKFTLFVGFGVVVFGSFYRVQ